MCFFQHHLWKRLSLAVTCPWFPPWKWLAITGFPSSPSLPFTTLCPSWMPAPSFSSVPLRHLLILTSTVLAASLFLLQIDLALYELVALGGYFFSFYEKCHCDSSRDCVASVNPFGTWTLLQYWFFQSTSMRDLCFICPVHLMTAVLWMFQSPSSISLVELIPG